MERKIEFILNNKKISAYINYAKTLLDFIRIDQDLKGTKEGCREGDCGACTVLIGEFRNGEMHYHSVNSCLYPMGKVYGKHVVTIEGLNSDELSLIQKEFNDEGATQCGFCTPGFVNSVTGYVMTHKKLHNHDAENAIAGNICRCTGYSSIKRTINNVVEKINSLDIPEGNRIYGLVNAGILPEYFKDIEEQIKSIPKNEIPINKGNEIIVGGGTDLFVQRADELLKEDILLLNNFENDKIELADNYFHIGSSVTIEQFKNSELINKYFPNFSEELKLFASLPIRNSATIGGNLVNASPIGDLAIIFLTLNAKLKIVKSGRSRTVRLDEFYNGYKDLDLSEGELVDKIIFEVPKQNTFFSFEKVSKRTHLDIASVNTALCVNIEGNIIKDAHLSAGGIAPIPLFFKKTSEQLVGKGISPKLIFDTLDSAQKEISPISDIRGSEEYKRLLLNQLIKSHFIKLFPNLFDAEELL